MKKKVLLLCSGGPHAVLAGGSIPSCSGWEGVPHPVPASGYPILPWLGGTTFCTSPPPRPGLGYLPGKDLGKNLGLGSPQEKPWNQRPGTGVLPLGVT